MPIFQILILDPASQSRFDNALSLVYGLRGFSRLWQKPHISEADFRIIDGTTTLEIREQTKPSQPTLDTSSSSSRTYLVSLSGEYERIESLRILLTEFMKDEKFEYRYIIKDEISEYIACKLYPYLYQIENLLRGYLTKFMTTRIGPTWWQPTVPTELSDKAKTRKKNEIVFGKYVDNSAFLIDFDDLGELVYEQSSGFLTREDILKRVSSLDESIESLRDLKQELRTNYQKYFKEAFADRDFKNKWKKWKDLRDKIAHNNLFTSDDLTMGINLANEIITVITDADQAIEQLVITQSEREAMQEQVIAKTDNAASLSPQNNSGTYSRIEITEDEFLAELHEQESFYKKKPGGFVGLTRFVRFHLAELGYDDTSAQLVIESLKKSGKIEVYYVENPYVSGATTAALRTL